MKKLVVAALIIGVFVLYSFLSIRSNGVALVPAPSTDSGSAASAVNSSASGTSPGPPRYRNGSYTGSVANAEWGYVQVRAVIQQGKLADVQFLEYPNERSRSVQINREANPELTSEAIQAQSSQVDIVTGATDTSEAFIQSLIVALTQSMN
jgi:uncharacterized protein with FMN-binding domain